MFPSYAPAATLNTEKKMSDGSRSLKQPSLLFLNSITTINRAAIDQKIFSTAANKLEVLVTSTNSMGLNRKVNVV